MSYAGDIIDQETIKHPKKTSTTASDRPEGSANRHAGSIFLKTKYFFNGKSLR